MEVQQLLERARNLLTVMNAADLRTVYTHRAARIILIKQHEILSAMVAEGTLDDALAHSLFDQLQDESDRVNLEGVLADKDLVRASVVRKAGEDREVRESFRASLSRSAARLSTDDSNRGSFMLSSRAILRSHLTGSGASGANSSPLDVANPLNVLAGGPKKKELPH
ncbi:hypothetical protein B484DRAFT_143671 [Ochromonadaceae sp. CCMP2298]|nr:hypothetical protein B484DRAFT_143671 [Ochromonadaceae sp. CCMP2298]|eukprot:CAMPEP_0173231638 /NCGR_PEP_ID=MMETSP1142-20121109/8500_1 /TAXON_ID=483371 /ORGANISM="non described non described, Strain CCMP2298" /LENGTH=166 /DNA_ID=CAMNT_0014161027 /DNA_START=41 /DNA_END=541 /DNA_ORIENTATION=-